MHGCLWCQEATSSRVPCYTPAISSGSPRSLIADRAWAQELFQCPWCEGYSSRDTGLSADGCCWTGHPSSVYTAGLSASLFVFRFVFTRFCFRPSDVTFLRSENSTSIAGNTHSLHASTVGLRACGSSTSSWPDKKVLSKWSDEREDGGADQTFSFIRGRTLHEIIRIRSLI